ESRGGGEGAVHGDRRPARCGAGLGERARPGDREGPGRDAAGAVRRGCGAGDRRAAGGSGRGAAGGSSGGGRSARRVELPRVHKRYAVWDVATLARDYQSGVQTLLKAARFRRVWRWSTGPCPTWESPFTTPRQRWRQVLFCWLMALVTAVIIVATVL